MAFQNKLRFQIIPGERIVWAIGMVTIQWTIIEGFLTAIGQGLTEDDPATFAKFNQTRAFHIRMDQIEALAELQLRPAPWQELKAAFDSVKKVKSQRDRIVHGSWSGDAHNGPWNEQQVNAFSWSKPHPSFEWKLDYGGVTGVVKRIDDAAAGLVDWMIRHAGVVESGTFRLALTNTRRKPSQT